MHRIKLLDIVALLKNVPDKKLVRGQVGTVVEQLDENVFEVEFINKKGETIAMETLDEKNLFLLHFEPEETV